MENKLKEVKQYLLYTPKNKQGNWNIEHYDLWDDIQGRAMVFEMRGQPTITMVEYTDGEKETLEDTREII
jgi:hypothetical protein